jgi:hypothetical protein
MPQPNRIPKRQRVAEGAKRDWYIYRGYVASIAASANATNTINIRAHSDFIVHKLAQFTDIAGAVQTDSSRVLPLVTVQILDTTAGKNFFNEPIPIPAVFGSGTLPFIMPGPRRVAANAVLQFSFTNYSAATTYGNLTILLIGIEEYLK